MTNSTSIIDPMQNMLEISETKFRQKAYVHWYTKYGIEEDDFRQKFNEVQDVIDGYASALY
jgi:tubulin delta